MPIKLVNQIKESRWKQIGDGEFPFLSYQFFSSLEKSGCIGEGTGWTPIYIEGPEKSLLYSFIKDQSYGEYIFDWDWANFYHKYNIPYYPKLTSMIPFTSVTTSHFLGTSSEKLMESYEEYYVAHNFSSSHFLFLKEEELDFFKSYGYLIRDSFQYHFFNNDYSSFQDFLLCLKTKKAKQIRKERVFSEDIQFSRISGHQLCSEHAEEMYGFYISTIQDKQAIPYLKKEFFDEIFKTLKDNICYVQARDNGEPIAGALYFFDSNRLYGRYWGGHKFIANLHFELCYYQGIEFCIEKGLNVFEAGAQGEHKIGRGFKPVKTYSAHKFKQPQCHAAIKEYIHAERSDIQQIMAQLSERLPFK